MAEARKNAGVLAWAADLGPLKPSRASAASGSFAKVTELAGRVEDKQLRDELGSALGELGQSLKQRKIKV